jgi:hypothetical protein
MSKPIASCPKLGVAQKRRARRLANSLKEKVPRLELVDAEATPTSGTKVEDTTTWCPDEIAAFHLPTVVLLTDSMLNSKDEVSTDVCILSHGGEVLGQSLLRRASVLRCGLRAIVINHCCNYNLPGRPTDNIEQYMQQFLVVCAHVSPETPVFFFQPPYFPRLSSEQNRKISESANLIKSCIAPGRIIQNCPNSSDWHHFENAVHWTPSVRKRVVHHIMQHIDPY